MVAELEEASDWHVASSDVVGWSPGGHSGNLEVVEGTFPSFDGVAGEDGIPIEAVDGETAMVNRGK